MNPEQTFEQQHSNYPIFFNYHNYCVNVPALNYVEYLTSDDGTFFTVTGKQPSFCVVCDQHFRTPVIYNRHMRSRKHALKCIRTKMDKRRNKTNESLSLLPKDVIDSLICDLEGSLDEKDSFFRDIDLSKCNDNSQFLPSFTKLFGNDGDNGMQLVNAKPRPHLNLNNTNVPKIYPCSLCFRTLHSQELFDQHLQEKHFRGNEPIRCD